jgi:hypothetical protein
MKNKTFISLIALLLLASISFIGCNDDGGGGSSQALTENDFADNPSLRAVPDKQIIVDFLESPGSDTPQFDTGPVGIDEIPLTYPQTETDTFCWTDDNSEAMDYMVLLDSQGEEVLRVDVNGDCVTDTIEAGDYVMEFHHDGSMSDTLPIFMIPNPDPNQQAMKTDGLFNRFKVVTAKILRGIGNTISNDARAQRPVTTTVDYLLRTNSCQNCDLEGANFSNQRLSSGSYAGSTFRNAFLDNAFFLSVNFTNVNFTGASLGGVFFDGSRLTGAKLTGARLGHPSPGYNCAATDASTWCDGKCVCGPEINLHAACADYVCYRCQHSFPSSPETYPLKTACAVDNSCEATGTCQGEH